MNTKPGYQTTEFWITLASYVLPVFVLLGVVKGDEVSELTKQWSMLITGIGSVVASAAYIINRAVVKKASIEAQK